MCFDGDEVDAAHRYAHPCVNDDALVQDSVDNVDVTTQKQSPKLSRYP
jgi:hypothetical protein